MPTTTLLQIFESCLVVLTALFPIVNPLAAGPIFLSLTPGYASAARSALASKVALNSFWLLTGSMLIGSHILDFFGISIPVVQIGGGMVVISTGWTLLQREPEQEREDVQRKVSPKNIASRAFYPLTLPLTVGPGSISVAITLGANQALHPDNTVRFAAAIIGPALMAVTIYLSYRFAERLARFLGPTAMNVIVRLASFTLVCIGVQIVWNGIKALLTLPR
ncbi:MAG TPA: MarC family protein [Bryobacteraceae bacterium]|nr:MarC family protein [Bryobacteraceae bacterium]